MRKRTLVAGILALIMVLTLVAACTPTPPPPPPPPPKTYNDGVYTAVSQANQRGFVWVGVTISDDKITEVEIKEFDGVAAQKGDDYPWDATHVAWVELAAQSVEKNTWDVDVVAEATTTSNKYREAAKFALEKAKATPTVTTTYFDGTFMGASEPDARGGYGIAWVTIENDEIIEVLVDEVTADGTRKDWPNYPWPQAAEAREVMADRFVAAGPDGIDDVDTVAQATGSSNHWKAAVQNALDSARVK